MRRRASLAHMELGYYGAELSAWNAEAQLARAQDRHERQVKRAEAQAVPARRGTGKQWFALMHQAVDGEISCTDSGVIRGGEA